MKKEDMGNENKAKSTIDEVTSQLAKFTNIVKHGCKIDFDRAGNNIIKLGNDSGITESDIISMDKRLKESTNND